MHLLSERIRQTKARPNYVGRRSPQSALDDFPTPPWATRALIEYVVPSLLLQKRHHFYDSSCGRGYIVRTFRQLGYSHFKGSDVKDYGYGFDTADYLKTGSDRPKAPPMTDYEIGNPPYKAATQYAALAIQRARRGVALLVQTLFVEGGKQHVKLTKRRNRWDALYKDHPPTAIGVFCGRIPFARGRVVRRRAVFTSHSWFWWDLTMPAAHGDTRFIFIPPEAQDRLERPGDYDKAFLGKK